MMGVPLYFLEFQNWSLTIRYSLGNILRSPSPIDTTVIFMFHSFFSSLVNFKFHVSIVLLSFAFRSAGIFKKSTCWQILFFLLFNTRSDLLVEIGRSVCISKSQSSLCISFSRTDSKSCIYHFLTWSNFTLLHSSQWIIFFTQSCLHLYSYCASLLHSLIIWLLIPVTT